MYPLRKGTRSYGTGTGFSFGTFGELLQGVDTEERDFLVTLPIRRFSNARFTYHPALSDLLVSPGNKQKSRKLAAIILKHYGYEEKGFLELNSNIPVGKGLASSSADLVATARALDKSLELHMTTEDIQFFIREIEPTDGVMYEGVVSFFHRMVQVGEFLGNLPQLTILGFDEGGEIDTVEFNKLPKPFTQEEKIEYDQLRCQISKAILQDDVRTVGEIATRSALLNQKLRYKKHLDPILHICKEVDGLGVVVAHSGTCLGILLSPECEEYAKKLYTAYTAMQSLEGEITIYHTWSNRIGIDQSGLLYSDQKVATQ
ncbi:kinase [Paenibacillus sp. SC116]|uniref:GHMP family kinase ATP-binding protein n=1 Tax=Paenibacillus sp. SC116 TaxID=2968986 RepID=UPI00215AA2AB|nr:kinase [Paenibacillus sp. SC116]MCR8844956.1 kinase [Paenibacillus sp. SC116]